MPDREYLWDFGRSAFRLLLVIAGRWWCMLGHARGDSCEYCDRLLVMLGFSIGGRGCGFGKGDGFVGAALR